MPLPKIGVVISTYQRPDGKTPDLIKRAIDSLLSQTYQNWKLYLIGDKYETQKEFDQFISWIPSDKILALNLPVAVERNRYPQAGQFLWHSGGVNAFNIGIEFSVNEGYDYICPLDHDEKWLPNHLEELSKAINQTQSLFLYTKSFHFTGEELPQINSSELYLKHRALPARAIKSSFCVNFKIIPLRFKDPLYSLGICEPSDAHFLNEVNSLLEINNQDTILINKVTVIHDQEGYTKTLNFG